MSKDNYSKEKLIAKIIMDTHVIEKGLTMPETRFGFGQERLILLIDNLLIFFAKYRHTEFQVNQGIEVVKEYFHFHSSRLDALNTKTLSRFNKFKSVLLVDESCNAENMQINMKNAEYFNYSRSPFDEFSNSRSSIRHFTEDEIDLELINKAIQLSQNTPSACNRQSVRIHVFSEKFDIEKILKLQGGNRGFGHLVNKLILVTFDTASYFEQNERNTGFVDGGMFCMNLLYALHFYHVGACILNASHTPEKDKRMRQITNIPQNEIIVAFIGCGSVPKEFRIAKSLRYPAETITSHH
jgi:nitroreductase